MSFSEIISLERKKDRERGKIKIEGERNRKVGGEDIRKTESEGYHIFH